MLNLVCREKSHIVLMTRLWPRPKLFVGFIPLQKKYTDCFDFSDIKIYDYYHGTMPVPQERDSGPISIMDTGKGCV